LMTSPPELDVVAAVVSAQAGDRDAFTELYRLYVRDVYRFVSRRTVSADEAEDVVQETFLRALRGIGQYEWEGVDFRAWLVRIARNVLVDRSRTATLRRTADEAFTQGRPVHTPSPEDVAIGLWASEAAEALRALPVGQRDVLLLRTLDGMSVEETALVLGVSRGAVRVAHHRAVRRMRRLLTG
jgi:RNA polymerase sigma-70 factor, ECF subfamily